jgi:hypothetical protein
MRGRPCKYGERVDGKCPPKPKTRKQRACKYGQRINGKCPPKPKTQPQTKTRKQRACKYGERVNGKCPPKPKANNSTKNDLKGEKYAHHVECTIRYYFLEPVDFKSEKELSDWFKNGDSYEYIYPDEEDDKVVFNFKYRAQLEKMSYGSRKYANFIHVEFDTNKDPDFINENILGTMENNDPDGNYPVRGALVYGEIVDDSIYISNTEEYS